MSTIHLPPLDPGVLLLVAATGAVLGAASTVASYVAVGLAVSIGKQVEVLPELEAGQGTLPLPHGIVAKLMRGAP